MKPLARLIIESIEGESEDAPTTSRVIKVTVVEERQSPPDSDDFGDSVYADPETDSTEEEITYDEDDADNGDTVVDKVVDYLRDKGATMQVRPDSFETPDASMDRDRIENGIETRYTYILDDSELSEKELKQIANRLNYNM